MKDALIFVLVIVIALLALGDEGGPRALIEATNADYEQCVGIKTTPLLRSPDSKVDYRLGEHFNDKGVT